MKSKLIIIFLFTCTMLSSIRAKEIPDTIIVSEDIQLFKLSDSIYLHRSFYQTENWGKIGANGMIIVSGNEALLIDTPWDNKQTEKLFNWIKDSLDITISAVIASHWHEDRMGGLSFLQSKGVESYANQMTLDIANEKELPVPNIGFTDSLTINFYNIPIICYYLGGGHSTDNIFVSLPTENILFGGCAVKDQNSTNLGNLTDADLTTWPSTMDKSINMFSHVKTVIPGHGEIGGTELLQHTQQLLENNK